MRVKLLRALSVSVVTGLLISACASRPVSENGITINDPYEGMNRRVHEFNKGLDRRVIGPVAKRIKGEDDPADAGKPGAMDLVTNMGSNLSLPGKVVNGLLQGRPGPAIDNAARFVVNSTLGLAGMFDPAGNEFGVPETDTDFGETLAVWGVPEGPYVELPVLGPSTQRDAFGKVIDVVIDPLVHVLTTPQVVLAYGLRAGSKAGDRARFGDTVDSVLQDSADSYAQTRLIYLMHRRHDVGEERDDIDPYAESDPDAFVIDPYEQQ